MSFSSVCFGRCLEQPETEVSEAPELGPHGPCRLGHRLPPVPALLSPLQHPFFVCSGVSPSFLFLKVLLLMLL